MEQILKFLQDAGTWYIATDDHGQPRVRPFGAQAIINGKLYIATNNTKDVYKQILENPKVEISGMAGGKWIRFNGELVADDSREAKAAMLEACPSLKNLYSLDDGIFAVLYFTKGKARICSFTDPIEEISFQNENYGTRRVFLETFEGLSQYRIVNFLDN